MWTKLLKVVTLNTSFPLNLFKNHFFLWKTYYYIDFWTTTTTKKKNSRTKKRTTCAEKSAENCVLEQRRISRNHTESAVLLLKVTRSANTRWRPARKMNSVNYKLMFSPFNLLLTLGWKSRNQTKNVSVTFSFF